jgi:hypothetical protein
MARRVVGVLVVVLIATLVGYAVYLLRPSDDVPEGNTLSPNTRRELGERVIRTLEVDDSAGRVVLAVARRVCAARVFGAEPLRAERVADVEKVYARVNCVEVKADNTAGVRRIVPIAMHFGSKVRVEAPSDGSSYADDVKRIFPSRLRHAAGEDEVTDRNLQREVDQRLRALPPPG